MSSFHLSLRTRSYLPIQTCQRFAVLRGRRDLPPRVLSAPKASPLPCLAATRMSVIALVTREPFVSSSVFLTRLCQLPASVFCFVCCCCLFLCFYHVIPVLSCYPEGALPSETAARCWDNDLNIGQSLRSYPSPPRTSPVSAKPRKITRQAAKCRESC